MNDRRGDMRSARSKFSVLLISDDERMQRMASWIMLEEGYYLVVCPDAGEAVKHAGTLAPDVILLDSRERIMNDEACALRAAFGSARLAALHFHGVAPTDHVDAECHLHTPFHADDLLKCLEDALAASVGSASSHSHAY